MEISKGEIQTLEKQVSPLVRQAGSYVINSVESVEEASAFLRKVKDTENNIERKRLEFTAPLNQSLKAINETFKRMKAPLEQARYLLTNKILSWKRAETERLAKEEARRRAIQEAHEKKGHEVSAPVVLERPDNKIGNTQTTKYWTFEIVSFAELDDAYKMINSVYINQKIRAGVRDIKGLKIVQKERLSIV
jgi:hypothetical protein